MRNPPIISQEYFIIIALFYVIVNMTLLILNFNFFWLAAMQTLLETDGSISERYDIYNQI